MKIVSLKPPLLTTEPVFKYTHRNQKSRKKKVISNQDKINIKRLRTQTLKFVAKDFKIIIFNIFKKLDKRVYEH